MHYIITYAFFKKKRKKEAVKNARRTQQIYSYSSANCQEISDFGICVFYEKEKSLSFRNPEAQLVKKSFPFTRK